MTSRDEKRAPLPIAYDALPSIPTPGSVLAGKYRIERVLGTGGMGVVAAAYHLQLARRVAIKYLIPDALEYPELIDRFLREALVAARIQGEHVARILDVGVFESGAPYIVLEYLEGVDLASHLERNGALPIVDAVRYVLEACEALAEAHAANVVHRDLKPENLFLAAQPDRRRIVKLLDFGISKIMGEPMTTPSEVLGTLMYMSPEQLRASGSVDHRTDIWSLGSTSCRSAGQRAWSRRRSRRHESFLALCPGVILYELLTGTPPFRGVTIVAVAEAVKANAPIPLRALRPEVPVQLEAAIARCLRTDPADRYASVLDLAVAIAPFATFPDRESVKTISGVLYGALSPPPLDDTDEPSSPSERPTVPTPPPTDSQEPLRDPRRGGVNAPVLPAPAPLSSDAPTTAGIADASASLPAFGQPQSARWRAMWWVPAIAAVAALMVIGGVSILPARPGAARPSAAPTDEVVVRISAASPHARVRIDDGPIVLLPLETRVHKDDRVHTIRTEADGYIPQTESVRFATDLTVRVGLEAFPPHDGGT